MPKILFYWLLSIFLALTFLTSCEVPSNSSVNTLPVFTTSIQPTYKPAITNLITTIPKPVIIGSPTQSSITLTPPITTSPITKIEPFTASIITFLNLEAKKQYAVIFTNNTQNIFKFSCTIRQHDNNGNYLSDYSVTSDFVPANTHYVYVLPREIAKGLTISDPQIVGVSPSAQPKFAIISISNLSIVPELAGDNRGINSFSYITGTLLNTGTVNFGTGVSGEGITPKSIIIQILKRTYDSGFTLAASSEALSSPEVNGVRITMPPPGEHVVFYIPLYESVIIKDAQKAIIDGEITILAPGR